MMKDRRIHKRRDISWKILLSIFTMGIIVNIEASSIKTFSVVYTDCPPVIDGNLIDPCWGDAHKVEMFIQQEPKAGKPAVEQTIVYCLYDKENLYFGIKCLDSNPTAIVANVTRRDKVVDESGIIRDDAIMIMLDTFRDHRNCYYFVVNPINTQEDGYMLNEGWSGGDEWDGRWYSSTSVGKEGWVAEFSIPFCILKFDSGNEAWGCNFYRVRKQSGEKSYWAETGSWQFQISLFGELIDLNLAEVKRGVSLHLIPYFSTISEKKSSSELISHLYGGVDIHYNISSALTAAITVNPDYSQIEADLDQINLAKEVELYLPEKRPFFLEGFGIFQTPIRLVYTRRIADINYGTKLTGKIHHFETGAFFVQSPTVESESRIIYAAIRTKTSISKSLTTGILVVTKEKNQSYNRALGIDGRLDLGKTMDIMGMFAKSFDPNVDKENNAYWIRFSYWGTNLNLGVAYQDFDSCFNPESGYMQRTDIKGPKASVGTNFWPNKFGLKRVTTAVNVFDGKNHLGEKKLYGGNIGVEVLLQNKLDFACILYNEGHLYSSNYYRNKWVQLCFQYNPEQWNVIELCYSWGKYYDADMFYPYFEVTIKPTDLLSVSLNSSYQYLRYFNYDERYWVNILKADYKVNDQLSCRIFVQSSELSNKLDINFLLKYDFFVGSHIYLAWNEARNMVLEHNNKLPSFRELTLQNRMFFIKMTYNFGI